uniref:Uncharacterized protein n=1 Tax=Acrobeloides nanus TaxID=290746 RepID=A0A914DT75_9BILA
MIETTHKGTPPEYVMFNSQTSTLSNNEEKKSWLLFWDDTRWINMAQGVNYRKTRIVSNKSFTRTSEFSWLFHDICFYFLSRRRELFQRTYFNILAELFQRHVSTDLFQLF